MHADPGADRTVGRDRFMFICIERYKRKRIL
jgi:hypothetical protein